jgi:protoporphyrinogen oxidase
MWEEVRKRVIMKTTSYDLVIVGGGLPGLTAAIYAARGGARVIVLERSSRMGGRAATTNRNGYCFNVGAHALYRRGVAATTLTELGVTFDAAPPSLSGLPADCGGRLHTFASGGVSLLVSELLGLGGKHEFARFFTELPRVDPSALDLTVVTVVPTAARGGRWPRLLHHRMSRSKHH